ncbi:MAG: hypothetical protein AAB729_01810 [Patescibacteria group bacterium]
MLSIVGEENLYSLFTLKRMAQNTSSYALTDKKILEHKRFSEQLGKFRYFKFLDKSFGIPALLVLFGNNVSMVSVNGGSVKTVIIKDRLINEVVKFLFMSYWGTLPEK